MPHQCPSNDEGGAEAFSLRHWRGIGGAFVILVRGVAVPRIVLALLGVVALASSARADRIAPIAQPVERALRVPVVVVGKVAAVEKEPVEATLYPGATQKVAHKIAVVKVETNLLGAANTTHLKVGFVPSGTAGIRPGRGPDNPELKEGQEWLFFL